MSFEHENYTKTGETLDVNNKNSTQTQQKPLTNSTQIVKIGARGSPLAVQQAEDFAARFKDIVGDKVEIEIHTFTTSGDQLLDKRLQDAGGKGLFTRELDIAQLSGRIDIVVHSLKDVPTVLPDGLKIGCYLPREDPRDALFGNVNNIKDLHQGATLGTASLRRSAQALALRPDLKIVMFRGNIQTRLRKLAEGQADATLLAAAGLNRLGMTDKAAGFMPKEEMLPACGQGIVCTTLTNDAEDWIVDACQQIDVLESRIAAIAERAFLKRLDGSCRTPIAGHLSFNENGVDICGEVLADDGSKRWFSQMRLDTIPDESQAAALGLELGEKVAQLRDGEGQ